MSIKNTLTKYSQRMTKQLSTLYENSFLSHFVFGKRTKGIAYGSDNYR